MREVAYYGDRFSDFVGRGETVSRFSVFDENAFRETGSLEKVGCAFKIYERKMI